MIDATHMFAVSTLRNAPRKCVLKISREVLLVLPDNAPFNDSQEMFSIPPNGDILRHSTTPDPLSEVTPTPHDNGSHDDDTVTTEASTGQVVVKVEVLDLIGGRDTEREAVLLDVDEETEEINQGVELQDEINQGVELPEDEINQELELQDEINQEVELPEDEVLSEEEIGKIVGILSDDVPKTRQDPYVNIEIAQSLLDEALAYQGMYCH